MLRLLYKHYGGITFFENKSTYLLSKCLENAVKKEQEIPNIILECINAIKGSSYSLSDIKHNKKMRSSDEILKDYGLK